jgi:hypothetical protein
MRYKRITSLSLVVFLLSCGSLAMTSDNSSQTYQSTRKLLSQMNDRVVDNDKLATLFKVGDERVQDLIEALDDSNPEISLRAQIVIRYLGDELAMKKLFEWYSKRQESVIAGPVPLPLKEWDYKVINANYIDTPPSQWRGAEPYIYALALDDSAKAKTLLNQLFESAGHLSESTVVGRALERVQSSQPKNSLPREKDLARLVLKNAFFVSPIDQKYTSSRLLALSQERDKALVEVYINRGALAEEWYHVVLSKCDQGWKFFSIYQVAIS